MMEIMLSAVASPRLSQETRSNVCAPSPPTAAHIEILGKSSPLLAASLFALRNLHVICSIQAWIQKDVQVRFRDTCLRSCCVNIVLHNIINIVVIMQNMSL